MRSILRRRRAAARDAAGRDRISVEVRRTWPSDFPEVLRLHESMSARSRRLRFFTESRAAGRETAHRICHTTGPGYLALAATVGGRLIGVAELALDSDAPDEASLSFLVEDRYRGRGVGRLLLARLVAEARSRGVRTLVAHVLAENEAALNLFAHSGLPTETSSDEGVRHLRMQLGDQDRA